MSRTPPLLAVLALLLASLLAAAGLATAPAAAADLDYGARGDPYAEARPPEVVRIPSRRARVVVVPAHDPDVLGDPALVIERPVGSVRLPPPPRVGGAFLYVPGLNGPDGPPAYPLLPFAFGYGF